MQHNSSCHLKINYKIKKGKKRSVGATSCRNSLLVKQTRTAPSFCFLVYCVFLYSSRCACVCEYFRCDGTMTSFFILFLLVPLSPSQITSFIVPCQKCRHYTFRPRCRVHSSQVHRNRYCSNKCRDRACTSSPYSSRSMYDTVISSPAAIGRVA